MITEPPIAIRLLCLYWLACEDTHTPVRVCAVPYEYLGAKFMAC